MLLRFTRLRQSQLTQLTRRLGNATGRLQEYRPAWWAGRTVPATVAEAEAAVPATVPEAEAAARALSQSLQGNLSAAAGAVESSVAAMLDAVDAGAWQQTAERLLTAAAQAEDLLPLTGGQRTDLGTALQAARARVGNPAGGRGAEQLRGRSSFVPAPDTMRGNPAGLHSVGSGPP